MRDACSRSREFQRLYPSQIQKGMEPRVGASAMFMICSCPPFEQVIGGVVAVVHADVEHQIRPKLQHEIPPTHRSTGGAQIVRVGHPHASAFWAQPIRLTSRGSIRRIRTVLRFNLNRRLISQRGIRATAYQKATIAGLCRALHASAK